MQCIDYSAVWCLCVQYTDRDVAIADVSLSLALDGSMHV